MITYEQDLYLFAEPLDAGEESDNGLPYKLQLVPARFKFFMDDSCVALGLHTISVTVPELTEDDLVRKAIDTLEEKRKRILADAEIESERLKKRISDLYMLTYKDDIIA